MPIAVSEGYYLALIPVIGVISGGLLTGLFALVNRRAAETEKAREELLQAKDARIALVTVERDEARAANEARDSKIELLTLQRDEARADAHKARLDAAEARKQLIGVESELASIRDTRNVPRRPNPPRRGTRS